MYGGCTDSFSVFGFLAFLLALLDLILELQAMNNDTAAATRSFRRRREIWNDTAFDPPDDYDPEGTTTHQENTTPLDLLCQVSDGHEKRTITIPEVYICLYGHNL